MADTRTAAQGGRPRPQTFGDAFREARLAGDKTFEFKGKTYSTKTAEEQGREIGARAAAGSGRGPSAGRTAADRDTASGRAEVPTGGSAKAPAERGERMSPLEMGLLTTAGALSAPLVGRAAVKAYPTVREAATKTYPVVREAASKVGEKVSEGVKSAKSAMDAARVARAERAAEAAKTTERVEPKMDLEPVAQPIRSARAKAEREELLRAREKLRDSLKSTGLKSTGPAKTESKAGPEFRSRTADRMDEREMGMKRGGAVKTYSKGGSVRGAGCETRHKKTRFV